MKQENKKIPTIRKIRQGLYAQVEEGEKRAKQKIIYTALATLLVASLLLFTAALMETGGSGKYVYVYGKQEQKISEELAFSGNIQFIDLNALADYCGIEKELSGFQAMYTVNGTTATFENGSDIAKVNGIDLKMPKAASIKNGYCLIPLSTAEELFRGVTINSERKTTTVSVSGTNIYMIVNNPKIEYLTDISDYLEYINSKDEYIFTLANKENPLPEDFPTDKDSLIEIPAEYRKDSVIYLYTVALQALEAMMNDMFEAGLTDTYVTSAYRSYAYQEILFNMYIDDEMESGLSYDAAVEKVLTYSSEPGKSEHQTGLCVDFTTKSIGGVVDDVFETTEAFAWLKDNAWKYGFILRYPENKVAITGYSYESWHYRFVGLDISTVMYQTGLCYEEYLEIFENKGE